MGIFKTNNEENTVKNNALTYCSAVLLGLLIVIYPVLAIAEADVASYLAFSSPIAAILFTGLGLSSKVDTVQQVAQKVERQTNGELKAQFEDLKSHIDDKISTDTPSAPQSFIPGAKR